MRLRIVGNQERSFTVTYGVNDLYGNPMDGTTYAVSTQDVVFVLGGGENASNLSIDVIRTPKNEKAIVYSGNSRFDGPKYDFILYVKNTEKAKKIINAFDAIKKQLSIIDSKF